jgi:hypothetical protein
MTIPTWQEGAKRLVNHTRHGWPRIAHRVRRSERASAVRMGINPRVCPLAQERITKETEISRTNSPSSAKGMPKKNLLKTPPTRAVSVTRLSRCEAATQHKHISHLSPRAASLSLSLARLRSLPRSPARPLADCGVGVAFWGLAREIKERKGLYGLRRIDPVKKHHQLEEEAAPMLRLLGVGERCVWLDLSSIRALRPVMRRLGLGAREMRVLWLPVFLVLLRCLINLSHSFV